MPKERTRKIITEETIPVGDGGDAPPNDDDLTEFMKGFGADAVDIKIYRVVGGRQKWVTTVSDPKAITEEELIDAYGPGRYLIRAKDKNGKWLPSRSFEIEGATAQPNGPGPGFAYASQNMDGMERIFAVMQESSQRTHEMLLAMITNMGRGNASTFDPTAAMTAMITGLASIKQLTAGTVEKDPLDQVSKILEIAERVGGNGGPKGTLESVLDMAKDALPMILKARGLMPAAADLEEIPTPPEKIVPVALPAPKVEASQLAVSPDEVRALWLKIEKAARLDMDPDGLAASILDFEQLGDIAAAVIVETIASSENVVEWWKKTGPVPDAIRGWFERFYFAVRELVKEPELETPSFPVTDVPMAEEKKS